MPSFLPANIAACYIYYRFFSRDFTAPIVSRLIRHGTHHSRCFHLFAPFFCLLIRIRRASDRGVIKSIKSVPCSPRFPLNIGSCLVNGFDKLCFARFSNADVVRKRGYILSYLRIFRILGWRVIKKRKKKKQFQISIPDFMSSNIFFFSSSNV